jgi:anti-anti-sigma regulatory factor
MATSKCEVRGSQLVATGDFPTDVDTSFDGACRQLLAGPAKELVADLSRVGYMSSTYIGLLAELALDARNAGKTLKIVAGPKLASVLKEAGLDAAAEIEGPGR